MRSCSMAWKAGLLILLLSVAPVPLGCGCDLEITTASLPDGVVGVPYNFSLDSHCGGDDWFLVEGLLPPGIGLVEDGELSGVPTREGTFIFSVGVVDFGSGDVAFKGFSLTVLETPPEPSGLPRR